MIKNKRAREFRIKTEVEGNKALKEKLWLKSLEYRIMKKNKNTPRSRLIRLQKAWIQY